jgi:hypothetical protein
MARQTNKFTPDDIKVITAAAPTVLITNAIIWDLKLGIPITPIKTDDTPRAIHAIHSAPRRRCAILSISEKSAGTIVFETTMINTDIMKITGLIERIISSLLNFSSLVISNFLLAYFVKNISIFKKLKVNQLKDAAQKAHQGMENLWKCLAN